MPPLTRGTLMDYIRVKRVPMNRMQGDQTGRKPG